MSDSKSKRLGLHTFLNISLLGAALSLVSGIAAAQGFAHAQYNLGVMVYDGRGVPQDYAEAARLYRLAAAQGHARAQYNLGFMLCNCEGIAQDYAEAARLYGLAAVHGAFRCSAQLGQHVFPRSRCCSGLCGGRGP